MKEKGREARLERISKLREVQMYEGERERQGRVQRADEDSPWRPSEVSTRNHSGHPISLVQPPPPRFNFDSTLPFLFVGSTELPILSGDIDRQRTPIVPQYSQSILY